MIRPDACWLYDGVSAYTNLTDNVKTNSNIDFLATSSEFVYIGLNRRFVGIYTDLSTNGSYGTLTGEYCNHGTWEKLSLIDSYAFNEDKYLRWVLPEQWFPYNFTDTDPHSATVPDTEERYWIRFSAASVTTQAVIEKIRCLPFVTYSTPEKVRSILQLDRDRFFTPISLPNVFEVETIIREKEDEIDSQTFKSWRFNVSPEEQVDYNRYGFAPMVLSKDIIKVYHLYIWNGNTWEERVEGRSEDYFCEKDTGMIYFTRLFLLPAAYGMVSRYYHWGYGEFKESVKIDYSWGRDPEVDYQFGMAQELATKMAAMDLLINHDYTTFIPSGTDKVALESKIRIWEEQIKDKFITLSGIAIW